MPPFVKRVRLDTPEGNALVFDHVDASIVFPTMLWTGFEGLEPLTMRLFFAAAKSADVIFDVGAYFGYFSLLASQANPRARIYAFEPFPESHALVEHYAALNACTNVKACQMALGERDEPLTLYVPDRSMSRLPNINSTKNRFVEGESFSDRGSYEIPVTARSIDSFVASEGLEKVDLMKIDTEETELQVFLGGRALFERAGPDVIIEIIFRNANIHEMLRNFTGFGYRMYEITAGGLVEKNISQIDKNLESSHGLQNDRDYSDIFLSRKQDDQLAKLNESYLKLGK